MPAEVPLLLATFVAGTAPLPGEREAEQRLDAVRGPDEAQQAWVSRGLEVLNLAIRAYRRRTRPVRDRGRRAPTRAGSGSATARARRPRRAAGARRSSCRRRSARAPSARSAFVRRRRSRPCSRAAAGELDDAQVAELERIIDKMDGVVDAWRYQAS